MDRIMARRAVATASPVAVWAALGIVYVVWGSTYLGIRVVDETMPPMLAASIRFFGAGVILAGWLLAREGWSVLRVSARELVAAGVVGTMLLVGGNGLVMVAEQHVASGVAALLVASEPIWIVVLRLATRERVSAVTITGLVVGLAGVAVLVLPGSSGDSALAGMALVLGAAFSWACGSFVSPRLSLPRRPLVSAALQMLLASVVLAVLGAAGGEIGRWSPAAFSLSSLVALGYLIVFGSVVAFTAYAWLLQNAPISKVSTYAYVNPAIAIILGWALAGEAMTATILVGAVVIVASVALIVRQEGKGAGEGGEPESSHAPAPVSIDAGEDASAA